MMTYHDFWRRLAPVYDEREAKAVARTVYEVRYGLSLADLLMGRDAAVPQQELEQLAVRLERQEPVQYVLGQSDFCGRTFCVEPGVLIPRPETAELCRWVTAQHQGAPSRPRHPAVLDIGTGSGCIAVTLALDLPGSHVTAWDVSPVALRVAARNARRLGAAVAVAGRDILQPASPVAPRWDIIVSNPPYVCRGEAAGMQANVLGYEPATALFVPDDDPLQFYRPIMHYALSALHPRGHLYLEVNPRYAACIAERLQALGFGGVTARSDQSGKTRFIKATR